MKPTTKRLVKKIFANICIALLILVYFGNTLAGQFSGQINSFLGTSTTQIVSKDGAESTE